MSGTLRADVNTVVKGDFLATIPEKPWVVLFGSKIDDGRPVHHWIKFLVAKPKVC
jgi:hypothetical protein